MRCDLPEVRRQALAATAMASRYRTARVPASLLGVRVEQRMEAVVAAMSRVVWPARDLEAEARTAAWSDFLRRRAAERRSQDEQTATPLAGALVLRPPAIRSQVGNRKRGRRSVAAARN